MCHTSKPEMGVSAVSAAIQFESVSKKFLIRRQRPRSFEDMLIHLVRRNADADHEVFWALRDVSFDLERGQMAGMIGHNGAGKSTALKLVARIIDPTAGKIQVNGRVGALLELGAGFHPDLTGRENIYLNGAILGLSRAQIRARLDQIIAFAELERFIDVASKNYSSGMSVRLGFSIAVHTEPEILLVDEVLAVGDAPFQKKCIDRIDHMRHAGTSILFVSHDLDSIRNLCDRVMWLNQGDIVADGDPDTVVRRYTQHFYEGNQAAGGPGASVCNGTGDVVIEQVHLLTEEGAHRDYFVTGEPMIIELHYRVRNQVEQPVLGLHIHRTDGIRVAGPDTQSAGLDLSEEGQGVIRYAIPRLSLLEGIYYLSVFAQDKRKTCTYDHHEQRYPFRVLNLTGEQEGFVSLLGEWETVALETGS